MNEQSHLSFREWADHYGKELDAQRLQISELTKAVSSLSADVKSIVENQRGLANRINRPIPVAAYVSALLATIAVMISFSTLLVAPIKESIIHMQEIHTADVERNLDLHIMMKEDIESTQISDAKNEEALRWLEKNQDRNFNIMREHIHNESHGTD